MFISWERWFGISFLWCANPGAVTMLLQWRTLGVSQCPRRQCGESKVNKCTDQSARSHSLTHSAWPHGPAGCNPITSSDIVASLGPTQRPWNWSQSLKILLGGMIFLPALHRHYHYHRPLISHLSLQPCTCVFDVTWNSVYLSHKLSLREPLIRETCLSCASLHLNASYRWSV